MTHPYTLKLDLTTRYTELYIVNGRTCITHTVSSVTQGHPQSVGMTSQHAIRKVQEVYKRACGTGIE